MRPTIYVAGPYSAATHEERLANVNAAIDAALELRRRGWAPFVPHLSHFMDERATAQGAPVGYDQWLEWDDAILERMDAVVLLKESPGAEKEFRKGTLLRLKTYDGLGNVPDAAEVDWSPDPTRAALHEVLLERRRQDDKWGQQNHDRDRWFGILAEEFGEVAREVVDFPQGAAAVAVLNGGDPEHRQRYLAELVQVAAVAVAMIECEVRKYGDPNIRPEDDLPF